MTRITAEEVLAQLEPPSDLDLSLIHAEEAQMTTHICRVHSHYTLCRWAKQVVIDMGHQVVTDTYYKNCSLHERLNNNTCKECKKKIEK